MPKSIDKFKKVSLTCKYDALDLSTCPKISDDLVKNEIYIDLYDRVIRLADILHGLQDIKKGITKMQVSRVGFVMVSKYKDNGHRRT